MDLISVPKINRPSVIGEIIDGEVIIINLLSGHYFSAVGVGARVWRYIEEGYAVECIVDEIAEDYGAKRDDIEPSIMSFVTELAENGLIEQLTGDDPGAKLNPVDPQDPACPVYGSYEDPTLSIYTDMTDLLLLDPIHELDSVGWPTRQSAAE